MFLSFFFLKWKESISTILLIIFEKKEYQYLQTIGNINKPDKIIIQEVQHHWSARTSDRLTNE